MGTPPPGQGSPVHPLASGESQEQRPLPASVRVLNQSSNFSKQVSSATGCLGSARAAQRAGRSWAHSGSMTRPGVLQRKGRARPAPALVASSPPACSGPRAARRRAGRNDPGPGVMQAPRQSLGPGRGVVPGRESVCCKPRGLGSELQAANRGLWWEGKSMMLT